MVGTIEILCVEIRKQTSALQFKTYRGVLTTGDVPGCKYIVRPLHTASSRLRTGKSAYATQAGRGPRPRECAWLPTPTCREGEDEEEAAAAAEEEEEETGREEDDGGGGGGGGRAAARSTVKARPVSSRELA